MSVEKRQKAVFFLNSHQLEDLLQAAPYLDHLHYVGLMTIPPFYDDPENARPHFRKLRELRITSLPGNYRT